MRQEWPPIIIPQTYPKDNSEGIKLHLSEVLQASPLKTEADKVNQTISQVAVN